MDRLKTITTFVQIARSGSLAKAAHELEMSRSLVSAHLKQLEDHLGVLLVKRTTRSLVLTEAGSEYLRSCTELINGFVAAEGRLAAMQQGAAGHLKIMASMAFGTFRLGRIILDFTRRFEDIRVSLILLDRGFAPSDFLEGDFDLGLSMDNMEIGTLINAKLGVVAWVPCVGARYFEKHDRIQVPQDLVHHNCLVHRSYAPASTWSFHGAAGAIAVKVSGSLFTNSAVVLKDAVRSLEGVAMLPLYAVRPELESGMLQRILPDYEGPGRPLYLVYQDSRYLPNRARLFIDHLKKELKRHPL
jgi:DNA-binding transcriptional LysR family regulator